MAKIAILVGHGKQTNGAGYDPGACNNGYEEFKLAKEIAQYAYLHLKNNYKCTPTLVNYNGMLNLDERIAMYKTDASADAIFEIHLNSASGTAGTGTEAWYYPGDEKGRAYAKAIAGKLSSALNIPTRGNDNGARISEGQYTFGIVYKTKPTAILIETCFINNPDEVAKVATAEGQLKAGQAIAEGIAQALVLEKIAPTLAPQQTTLYKVQVGAFEHEINAQRYSEKLKADGFDCFVVHIDGLYKVQTGAFANELNAENFLNKLKYKGYKPFIIAVSQSTATSQAPNPVQQVNYFPETPYTGVSIVSGLSAIGVNGTYAYREKIAKVNGIVNYKGTAEQNTKMLNLLKQGKLIRP